MDKNNYKQFSLLIFSSLIGLYSYSQTGPGGVGSSSDNSMWYDASSLSQSNNSAVSSWSDISGNGNDVSQNTGGQQPVFLTNQINSLPAISFDGSNDYLESSGFSELNNANTLSIFFVASSLTTGTSPVYLAIKSSDNSNAIRIQRVSTFRSTFPTTTGTTNTNHSLSNGYHLLTNIWDATAPLISMYRDGTFMTSNNAANGSIATNDGFIIGKAGNTNGGFYLGQQAELIVYTTSVNTSQRNIIENYLAAKYNLTISNDKYSFQATHGHEVAGIGQESASDNHTTAQGTSIVRISGATDLENGEYAIWGHDDAGTGNNGTDIPTSFTASGLRLDQEWRIDMSGGDGSVGNVTIRFDMNPGTNINFGADKNDYVIISDPDGDFTDGDETVHAIAPNVSGNLITFSNVPLADGDFFTIGNPNEVTECASFNTNTWTAATWIPCFVTPDSTTNATISDGTTITIAANQSVNDLTIEADGGSGGGTLVINANRTLIVTGDLTIDNGASLTMNTGSKVIFRGTAAQTLLNNSGSSVTLHDLDLNNSDGLTIDGSDDVELSNGLTLTNGDLSVDGQLTFLSDATRTAHVNAVPNGSIIDGTGTVTVQRFRDARNSYWGNITTSGVDCKIEELDDNIFISGITGGDGSATQTGGGVFVSFWFWDETNDAYDSPASTNDDFEIGRGYEVWLADNNTTWNAQAWDLTGALFLDPISIPVSSSGSNWNLIGNPYPGYLDWDNIIANHPGIDNGEFYFMDANGGGYTLANGAGLVIAPGEAMWIQTTGIATIDLDPANDLLSDQNTSSYRKRGAVDALQIQLRNNEQPFGSNAYVMKDDMSFVGKDDRDVSPLRIPDSRSCLVSIVSGADESMVNYVPTTESFIELPVKVESGVAGQFTLNISGLESFSKYQCIQLVDQETGEQFPISDNYTLDIELNDGSLRKDYTLIMQEEEDGIDCVSPSNADSNSPFKIWSNGDDITIDFYLSQSALSSINIYNALGDLVSSQNNNVSFTRTHISGSTLSHGVYFVNVSVNGYSETQRIILN